MRRFINLLDPLIPQKLYRFGQGESSHLTVAFDRYCDALLRQGILEERIANAVMGLEALLLDQNQELSYRLSLRLAKSLSFLNEEAKEVKKVIK